MEQSQFMPEDDAWEIIRQVYNGLYLLQSTGLVHRDIKRENIFLDEKPLNHPSPAKFLCYLGDFGLSKLEEEVVTICGTPGMTAPEISKGKYD